MNIFQHNPKQLSLAVREAASHSVSYLYLHMTNKKKN